MHNTVYVQMLTRGVILELENTVSESERTVGSPYLWVIGYKPPTDAETVDNSEYNN